MKTLHKIINVMAPIVTITSIVSLPLLSCQREPELHLYASGDRTLEFPIVDLELDAVWDYELAYNIVYDWRAEWYYGWDEEDLRLFGQLDYSKPSAYNLRRYFTGSKAYDAHRNVLKDHVVGNTFRGSYSWGFWDILVWNDVTSIDGVQSLNFDEKGANDPIMVYTNPSMSPSRYHAPRFTHAFYQPEPLFAAYEQAIEINEDLRGFNYDAERNVWVKKLDMLLEPVTYIYLTQVVLHNNKGRIVAIDGECNASGFARTTTLNTGIAGDDAITLHYNARFKQNRDMNGESVDIAGGRFFTFGICGHNAYRLTDPALLKDPNRHYMDVNMQFYNGIDSTFVFDITDQVRHRYKGGVITVELDMDTVPVPQRAGGSAFNAVVKDFEDGGTHEFEM
jgi:hypothetical protein